MNHRTALVTIAHAVHLAGVLVFVAVLYVARDALMPLTLGGLLAFLLTPAVNRMQRWGLSNVVSVLVTATAVFAGLSVLTVGIWSGASQFVEDLPNYRGEITAKVQSIHHIVTRVGGRFSDLSQEASPTSGNETIGNGESEPSKTKVIPSSSSSLGRLLRWDERSASHDGSTPKQPLFIKDVSADGVDLRTWAGGMALVLGPLGTTGLVTVFALFALLYRDDLRDRFTSLVSRGNYVVTAEALNEASARIGKYLLAQLIVNVSYGVIFSLGLLTVGYFFSPTGSFPYILLLGTLAASARFIPYVGPIAGAGFPLALSLVVFPGYQVAMAVATMVLVLELVSNNVLEPWLYGSSTGVSPVAVILAAVFWGWLWGPIGLLLATPLTVCAVVLGQYVPRFRFLSVLLSERVQLNAGVRGYQRLLSGDSHKLAELLQDELKQQSPAQVLDRVVVPVIKLILRDNDKHGNDELLFSRLRESLETAGLIDASVESPSPDNSPSPDATTASVAANDSQQRTSSHDEPALPHVDALPLERHTIQLAAVAARHQGEELVLSCVARLLPEDVKLEILDREDFVELTATTTSSAGSLVLVIPPQGVSPAREIVRRLRRRNPRKPVIAACIGRFKQFDRIYSRLQSAGTTGICMSVEQTVQRLLLIAARQRRALRLPPAAATS